MGPIKPGLLDLFDNPAHYPRNLFKLFRRGFIKHPERKDDTALPEMRIIVYSARKQVIVAKYQHLTAQTAQAGRFQSNSLNRSQLFAHNNKMTDFKRPVQKNRQGGKQIAQYTLRGKPDRDAANTKAGNQGGDVYPHIFQNDEQDKRPQHETAEQTHHPHPGTCGGILYLSAHILLKPDVDEAVPP